MNKWNLIVDIEKCCNCNNCTMAMKDEYVANDFPGYSRPQPNHGHDWINIKRHIRGSGNHLDVKYVPVTCNHCDNAPCVRIGRGVVTKRADGIVIIDPKLAKGRKDLVEACPYNAIWWNDQEQLPQHWTFDAHLIDNSWDQPRIAHACPTGALLSVKISDDQMAKKAIAEGLEVMSPELDTKPRVYYKGLSRLQQNFVAGNVSYLDTSGLSQNIQGVLVKITTKATNRMISVATDEFGDFLVDGLLETEDALVLTIAHDGYQTIEQSLKLTESTDIGSIILCSSH